jgi:hypothetical protein
MGTCPPAVATPTSRIVRRCAGVRSTVSLVEPNRKRAWTPPSRRKPIRRSRDGTSSSPSSVNGVHTGGTMPPNGSGRAVTTGLLIVVRWARGSRVHAGVEGVAQAVADEIDGQHD